MELEGFADPWEQLRLLADADRNDALLAWLERHVAGRRVLEIGCGTGLWSCVAASLGAAHVVAVEASPVAEVARALVHDNGLADRVEVLEAELEALAPREVDLAFGELLNADPFVEGVVETFHRAAGWLAPGGLLAPGSLAVFAALTDAGETAEEAVAARAEVAGIAERAGVSTEALEAVLGPREPYRYVAPGAPLVGPPVCLFEVRLGEAAEPPAHVSRSLAVDRDAAVGGVAVWFEARLEEDLVIANRPARPGHFGVLRCDFADPVDLPEGGVLGVEVEVDDGLVVRRR